jgi:hypothetical protein
VLRAVCSEPGTILDAGSGGSELLSNGIRRQAAAAGGRDVVAGGDAGVSDSGKDAERCGDTDRTNATNDSRHGM